ncbi:MAG: NADP-dependent malic enzyme [Candidatus Fermentibacteraceae bacterium]|nr:NADP-dependent malic enzyme [Candidatus Fermentibacteraceae bacterium]MBN2608377.1 NADP-dependent malic enzyme [Candidatus Fermentibacteraceae bacterium]
MKDFDLTLNNLGDLFPDDFSEEQVAKAKTVFLKELAYRMHKFYRGKMITVPKAGLYGFNWFNVWYTPGVSRVSTTIRDNNEAAYELSNKGNLIGVVSDSTRVLGDGNCTPPGGLGVMEGKAFLMKYLGGVDAVALCINNRDADGNPDPDKIIDFVKMAEPSFGGINLEDISQPNCFKVLDTLREECSIPVWHDDAQGTGCVTLAGLLGALEVVGKKLEDIRIVFIGAGASNTTIARLIITAGGDPKKMVMFDSSGSLSADREDIRADKRFYRKWELCQSTNPEKFRTHAEAIKGADALIAVSRPGPGLIPKEWIRSMARDPIVFACANPVPEIYPYEAKEAGAAIVATGRGDFPNQVNNSLGFPGILKGALLVRARAITDSMAVAAARSLANFAGRRGFTPDYIIPTMDEADVFPEEAADVAMQAIKDGVARRVITREQAVDEARTDIMEARKLVHSLMEEGFIKEPPAELIRESVKLAIDSVT